MKPICPMCKSDTVYAQSMMYRRVEDVDPERLCCPKLGAGAFGTGWREQSCVPEFMCRRCGFESDDIKDFLGGG
ncbi:MAG: hypothetical protein ABIH46_13970 [Chloroflexota bacterium]